MLIPRTSIHHIIFKYKSTKCIGNIIGCGQKRKTAAYVDRSIRRNFVANHRISSTRIKSELQSELNVAISESIIQRRAHDANLFGRVAKKKTSFNKLNHGKRLEYARIYLEKALGF